MTTTFLTLTYDDGMKLLLAVPDPDLFASQIAAARATEGITHAQFGSSTRPVLIALDGWRSLYASVPGEFAERPLPDKIDDVEVVAAQAAPSTVGVTNVIQQPPTTLVMPDRRSETAIERDPATGEIVKSTTLETSVPDAAPRPASELN
jgi:hypothetical protein